MIKKPYVVKTIRFTTDLNNEIASFAKANGLTFTSAVNMLLTNAVRNPKLINPNKESSTKND